MFHIICFSALTFQQTRRLSSNLLIRRLRSARLSSRLANQGCFGLFLSAALEAVFSPFKESRCGVEEGRKEGRKKERTKERKKEKHRNVEDGALQRTRRPFLVASQSAFMRSTSRELGSGEKGEARSRRRRRMLWR